MKLSSTARLDDDNRHKHIDLANLIASALDAWQREKVSAEAELEAVKALVAEYNARPFYKRWLTLLEPTTAHEEWRVSNAKRWLKWLSDVIAASTYKLTMEFNEQETEVLLFTGPKA